MAAYPWGGSEELWSQAALRLKSDSHKVSASTVWWPKVSPKIAELRNHGIRVYLQQAEPRHLAQRLWRKAATRILKNRSADIRWLLDQKPDLVCVSNGNYSDGIDFLEACCENKLPYVSIVQANAEFLWPTDTEAARLIRVYSNAERVFFVSERNRDLLEAQLGTQLRNAAIVRNPFNVPWEAIPTWPNDSQGLHLACVARLEPSAKGQDLLLHVLATEEWRARPVQLSLFGSGSMEKGLRRLVQRLGLEGRVHFRGQVGNVEEIWTGHHILVLPSRYEGLPLALVEAMLCSRPVVVTDVAGNAEFVEDGVSGFVAAAPTVELLREALERAWNRRADWRAMGLAARAAAQRNVPEHPAAMFAECLTELASGTGAKRPL